MCLSMWFILIIYSVYFSKNAPWIQKYIFLRSTLIFHGIRNEMKHIFPVRPSIAQICRKCQFCNTELIYQHLQIGLHITVALRRHFIRNKFDETFAENYATKPFISLPTIYDVCLFDIILFKSIFHTKICEFGIVHKLSFSWY